jgi:phage replication O-like protein O
MNRLLIPNTCQVPNVLLDEVMPHLPGSALKVLLAIVRKTYGFQKNSDRISYRTLQRLTGLSRDAVNQGIKALGPLLNITPGIKNVPTLEGVNEYSLNLDIETGELVHKSDQSEIQTSRKNLEEPVRKSDSSKPNFSKHNKTSVNTPDSSTIREERKLTRSGSPDPAQVAAFDVWYSAYPKHVGCKPALKAWLKLSPEPALIQTIMAATSRYVEHKAGVEARFILDPATWINQERWTDEPVTANGNGHSDGPPNIVKREGDMLTLADGSITPAGTYQRKYGIQP